MKQQIRFGVFETNSSSTHSITIVDKEDYDKWENGEVYGKIDMWEDNAEFLPVEEAVERNVESLKNQNCDVPFDFVEAYKEEHTLEKAYNKSGEDFDFENSLDFGEFYLSFDEYCEYVDNIMCYQRYTKEYKAKNGTEVVAFGYYGQDY